MPVRPQRCVGGRTSSSTGWRRSPRPKAAPRRRYPMATPDGPQHARQRPLAPPPARAAELVEEPMVAALAALTEALQLLERCLQAATVMQTDIAEMRQAHARIERQLSLLYGRAVPLANALADVRKALAALMNTVAFLYDEKEEDV